MTKAVNEAKVNMSWINPNQEYTDALHNFIARVLTPGSENRPNRFLKQIEEFVVQDRVVRGHQLDFADPD